MARTFPWISAKEESHMMPKRDVTNREKKFLKKWHLAKS